MTIYMYKRNWQVLSRMLIVLTKLMCELFIYMYHTHINLRPNTQLFEYPAACYKLVIFELLPGLITFASSWHAC